MNSTRCATTAASDLRCEHAELEFSPFAQELNGQVYVVISVRCSLCKGNFHWRGVDAGTPSRQGPLCSADGYELRAPIDFGPGSLVRLMNATGLADRLVNPDDPATVTLEDDD